MALPQPLHYIGILELVAKYTSLLSAEVQYFSNCDQVIGIFLMFLTEKKNQT